jgi:hypothetical protein
VKIPDLLPESGRPIAYFPSLRQVAGSTNAALLLCQLIYWHGKQRDPSGWIMKRASAGRDTSDSPPEPEDQTLQAETGLSYGELRLARRLLRQNGLVSELHRRSTHCTYFRLNLDAIQAAWQRHRPAQRVSARASAEVRRSIREGSAEPPLNRKYIEHTENTTERPPATQDTTADSQRQTPGTPLEALQHPMIQLFQQTCGRVPGRGDYAAVIDLMRHFHAQHAGNTIDFLRPFWLAWSSRRRTSDGRPYDPGSLIWLSEWAINGQIPATHGGAHDRTHPDRPRRLSARAKGGRPAQPTGVGQVTAEDRAAARRICHRRHRKVPLVP